MTRVPAARGEPGAPGGGLLAADGDAKAVAAAGRQRPVEDQLDLAGLRVQVGDVPTPAGADAGHDLLRRHAGGREPRHLGEADVRPPQAVVQALVGEGDLVGLHVVGVPPAARRPHHAAHLEDVGEVGVQAQRQAAVLRVERVVLDPDRLAERVRQDALADDAERLAPQHHLRVRLVVRVAHQVRVGQLDGAAVAGAAPRAQHHRPLAVEAHLVQRQEARVACVEPQAAAVPVHVAERVAHQEQDVVLEHQHAGEIRCARDRACRHVPLRVEDVAARLGGGCRLGARRGLRHAPAAPPSVRWDRRSAWSVVISASMRRSRSPSSTFGRLCRSRLMRWSVTRSWG